MSATNITLMHASVGKSGPSKIHEMILVQVGPGSKTTPESGIQHETAWVQSTSVLDLLPSLISFTLAQ